MMDRALADLTLRDLLHIALIYSATALAILVFGVGLALLIRWVCERVGR